MTRTVLLVDYFFPPLGGPGIQRTLGYVCHLPRSKWNPVVLTVAGGEFQIIDESLNTRVPADVEVVRAASIEPVGLAKRALAALKSRDGIATQGAAGEPFWRGSRWLRNTEYWLLFPDRHIGWLPFAVARGQALLRRRSIDVVYSSSTNIMTGHLVGYWLKRSFRRPWVVDFQDAWLEDYVSVFPTRVHRKAAERLERFVVDEADRITVATERHADLLRDRYGAAASSKLVVVPMGYDTKVFEGIEAEETDKFVISHFGSFYRSRSPVTFLAAVVEAIQAEPSLGDDLEVRFIGLFDAPTLNATEDLVRRHGLEEIVHRPGILPYRTALRSLIASAVLLLVMDDGVWGRNLLASKVMEYLALRRTVLALAPPGATADLVHRTRAGVVVPPGDVRAIRDELLRLYAQWKEGRLVFQGDEERIRALAWGEVAAQFADVLEASLDSRGRGTS
jgi:glycosyltransferase involved in cell wall biosynthesis